MELLALAGFVALLWLLHTAMVRIERMRPSKQAQRNAATARRKTPAKPER